MRNIKKILCALDLTPHSAVVAEYAVTMSKAFDAQVVVMYAAPALNQYAEFRVPPSHIENFVCEIVDGAEKAMEGYVAKHFHGVQAVGKVVNGYAPEEILKMAVAENADVIIMGTHGRKGIRRIIFGSVAEKIVKSSHIPVITIRPEA